MDKLIRKTSYIIAVGFGLGLIPKAPGTFGSLLGVALGVTLGFFPVELAVSTLLILTILSVFIIKEAEKEFKSHDPSAIVVDEIIGQAIPLIFIEATVINIALSFLFFRLFDIIKKGPVGYVDKHVKGALGVMLDDVVAGFLALGVVWGLGQTLV